MFGEGQGETVRVYDVPPFLDDEDPNVDPDASDLQPQDEETGSRIIPVWLRESSKSFRWGWVPLPLRKAGRATAQWVKGPDPPHSLLLKPLFPKFQELPVRYLEHFFPKRKHKISLLLLLYIAWFTPWLTVLLVSRSSGYIEGYGQPTTLSCATTYWDFGNGCGLNGNDCRPFSASTMAFRCPANCRDTKLMEPHTVGNETYNYQGLVVGGPESESTSPAIYRADSFVCQAAIHSGAIKNTVGGCGVVKLEGAAHTFPSVKQNGILSAGFPSTFPKSFSFVNLSSSQATCPNDPRWTLLGVTIAALTLLWIFCKSPPVLFFSTFFILFSHVGLVSDPPTYTEFDDLLSSLLSRMLPAAFVAYVLYKFCAYPLLSPLASPNYQLTKTLLYLPPAFFGALNNYTFARLIPLQRLTPHDIQQQPGAKVALAFVIPIVISIILSQAWQIRQGGLMPRYLKIYCTMGLIILILLPLPGLRLRIHHYILAILLMPGTAFSTRPSLIYQGLLLGLFVNGVARWGFASIIETPAALGEEAPAAGSHGWWGATYPNITDSVEIALPSWSSNETYHGNGNITFALWEHERMEKLGVDGVSVLVNDVERWRGYVDEDKRGEFTWHRHGHEGFGDNDPDDFDSDLTDPDDDEEPEDVFFRFAFLKGAEAGQYGRAGVWLKDGAWIPPPAPKA
ncbi:hypothetical protein ASPWEDRAFT_114955 [Aspergillus wentii DTO 134E9]|uniref:LCCL domain-containing protein n=1 Tax=Aspergillus wentii DTO 134E9 TaxID=1073089 RepID=A0A1L9RDL8_ASPWE|nr:uncharacterized protein ASPWEDRAFT_114955 [Aspergillus wentii DTO 134E9]KAI9933228.1 hypothetical protein MW887_007700 [Aspergillus wentii]OJJ32957.1 hypothetical protein ASPWEDRAFT_114955 [Aspergillus wentii DTO 134E9]